ncbi:NADH-quinone oxidoreductase subunit C [Naumannella halotolerans]|uniref:NADH-quinone oxidoreductase subunit C n=1 Tax=Naumannella halotolerans TaxID=993414 RepID=A0A4R7JA60_9ACTN|nr:NADH-quinone oxidoreductase subunit C [Naumannella halotolerans]TDT34451.1 NADH-quinone oxidoreductase subunit C [Naumannella halotolerans]
MTDRPGPKTPDEDQTIKEKPRSAEPGPKAGIEREDAPASDRVAEVAVTEPGPVGGVGGSPKVRHGMWGAGRGSGDTSGYGRMRRIIEPPAPTARPYGGWFDEVVDRIGELRPGAIAQVVVDRGELTLLIPRDRLGELAPVLRDDPYLRFEHCASVSGVHYPEHTGAELHVVHHLQSMTHNRRLRLEVTCPDADPHLPSVVPTYPAADWHERETWDMFGVVFDGHPALTRILMPDDWPGHPQRKDYPLGGIPVEYKGATIPPPDERRSYL